VTDNEKTTEPSTKGIIGFIGKTSITDEERDLLVILGRTFARAGKVTALVPQKGACEAVRVGVEEEKGELNLLEKDTISHSAHCFVYADERLLNRLRKVDPLIDDTPTIFLLTTTSEITDWLSAAKIILKDRGIEWPEDSPSSSLQSS
jgi:hypothetical protein